MRAWIETLSAFAVTIRNLGRPKVTEPLPWKARRAHPERYRASFALTEDEHGEIACIGCKACENVCPSQIISVELERRESVKTGKKRGDSDHDYDLDDCESPAAHGINVP